MRDSGIVSFLARAPKIESIGRTPTGNSPVLPEVALRRAIVRAGRVEKWCFQKGQREASAEGGFRVVEVVLCAQLRPTAASLDTSKDQGNCSSNAQLGIKPLPQ